jgi:[protein-PII] uridylyltransferase
MQKLHSRSEWHQIQQQFFAAGDAAPVLAGLSALIEQMTVDAFEASLRTQSDSNVTMLAVGGFGRRELFPFSDVDVLILIEREAQAAGIKNALSEFVRLLWDGGLRLSHSVRTVAECAEVHEGNIELSISLLDRRMLAGSSDLFAKLENKLPGFFERQGRVLIRHLCQLARERHEKFQGTFYHLEPNVKETPGGLRDLHLIEWLGKMDWLSKLRKPDEEEGARLVAPARFIHSLRCFLHYQTRRDQNLLSFDAQEALTTQPYVSFREPADMMREYFRNARVIYNVGRRALDLNESSESSLRTHFRDWRSRLSNSEFTVSNDRIYLRSPAQLTGDPAIFVRLLEFVARHGVPLSAETERRVEQASQTFAAFCEHAQPLWPALHSILSLPHAAAALRVMHETGLLLAMFPEWQNISSLVVPDFYHRYTVDEHTLVTIEKLAELATSKDPDQRRLAEILSEVEDLALLRFALLFHDSGKGAHSGDHARLSVGLAHAAMQRIQMRPEEQSAVEFLIEHHLDLSAVMSSRDLHDPATARLLALRIGTLERLKLLTLLTYADISAVNPAAMTPWRLEQLWETYRVTHQQLLKELGTERIADLPPDLRATLVAWPADFIRGFPSRYLRTHTPENIRVHVELYELSRSTGVAVQIESQMKSGGGVYRATIVASDRPALFAALAGAISSFGMDILKAEAFSNELGLALNTFVFADPKRTLELNPTENDRLRQTLEDVTLGRLDTEQLLRGRVAYNRLKKRTVQPRVHFDADACDSATLIEIIAEDRPGLLYDLSSAISGAGCNINVVLIDTEGRKAIDVFYVATNGGKLSSNAQDALSYRLLTLC